MKKQKMRIKHMMLTHSIWENKADYTQISLDQTLKIVREIKGSTTRTQN